MLHWLATRFFFPSFIPVSQLQLRLYVSKQCQRFLDIQETLNVRENNAKQDLYNYKQAYRHKIVTVNSAHRHAVFNEQAWHLCPECMTFPFGGNGLVSVSSEGDCAKESVSSVLSQEGYRHLFTNPSYLIYLGSITVPRLCNYRNYLDWSEKCAAREIVKTLKDKLFSLREAFIIFLKEGI